MLSIEKMQELGAVVNFWTTRIDALTTELSMLQDLGSLSRPGGDRYAADRHLREIKRKAGEIGDAEHSLRKAKRDLEAALEKSSQSNHAYAAPLDQRHIAH